MEYIKTTFSIKDLENLSGIKAHTIRIWEQRYGLLIPERSDTNIRSYGITQLQKLLNISLLNSAGYKISKIADITDSDLIKLSNQIHKTKDNELNNYVNKFILAMVTFDLILFEKTYNNCQNEFSFSEIFYKIFIPLLEKIGLLWQTDSIKPTHEHFISNLVRQKLFTQIEKLQINDWSDNTLYVLFLPLNEIHDIGLLYIHYELLSRQKRTVFLGSNIEISDLDSIQHVYDTNIVYVTYLTTYPESAKTSSFIKQINSILRKNDRIIVAGRKTAAIDTQKLSDKITLINRLDQLNEKL